MDPTMVNSLVAVSLMFLTLTLVLLVGTAVPLMFQAGRTLNAYERLAETVDTELKPTLIEIKQAAEGFNQLRSVTAQQVTAVGHRVEDVAGSFEQVAEVGRKHSTIVGAGLIAGLKSYLAGKTEEQTKKIASLRGENNG